MVIINKSFVRIIQQATLFTINEDRENDNKKITSEEKRDVRAIVVGEKHERNGDQTKQNGG